jgi:predicted glycoside hydrolase/deacetylase ChbG (UPF0249 family)
VSPDARILVINADDFGFTDGVTRGIVEAHQAGTVSSVSLMVNTPGFVGAREALQQLPALRAGLHLNLTAGAPLSDAARVASLIDAATGQLLPLRQLVWRAMTGALATEHVRAEVHAQLARAVDAGIALTHIDGHQHVHLLPGVAPVVRDAAKHFGIARIRQPLESLAHRPLRVRATLVKSALHIAQRLTTPTAVHAEHVRGISLQGGGPFAERLQRDLASLPTGVTELIVHPGYVDDALTHMDDYLAPREIERDALTSDAITSLLRALPVRLATFATV